MNFNVMKIDYNISHIRLNNCKLTHINVYQDRRIYNLKVEVNYCEYVYIEVDDKDITEIYLGHEPCTMITFKNNQVMKHFIIEKFKWQNINFEEVKCECLKGEEE